MNALTRSHVCGVTCQPGESTCNGYCKDSKIPEPGTYTMPLVDFGDAIRALKAGKRVAREGWNGKGMFVYFVPANAYPAQTGAAKAFFGEGAMVPYNAYMGLKGVDGAVSTWAPSTSDALAEDWIVLD